MKVGEILTEYKINKPFAWTGPLKDRNSYYYHFESTADQYEVWFEQAAPNKNEWNLDFDRSMEDPFTQPTDNSFIRVFSTVHKILEDFINKIEPEKVTFEADKKRAAIYRRMNIPGYRLEYDVSYSDFYPGYAYFALIKESKQLDEYKINASYSYRKTEDDQGYKIYKFQTDEREYEVIFNLESHIYDADGNEVNGENVWTLEFTVGNIGDLMNRIDPTRLSSSRERIQKATKRNKSAVGILATVHIILEDFIQEVKPKELRFSAWNEKLANIYKRLKIPGYDLEIKDGIKATYFRLVKNG